MPSLSAILIKKVLAVVTPRLKQKNIATTRKTQNQLAASPPGWRDGGSLPPHSSWSIALLR